MLERGQAGQDGRNLCNLQQFTESIVCLTEDPTEILYRLGEGARVVGIRAFTLRPPDARRDKPIVSAFIGGSVHRRWCRPHTSAS